VGERRPPGGAGGGAVLKRASGAHGRLAALLRAAGLDPRPLDEGGPPLGFALGAPAPGGFEAVAFAEPHGLTLGVKIALPPQCEMTGLAPTAERALKLLGSMMLGLSSQGLQVSPVGRYRGLEAVLLSLHVCPPLRDPARLREGLDRLRRTAHLLEAALREPPDRILGALRHAAGVRGALVAVRERAKVAAVPSFDPEVARHPGRGRGRARRRAGA
jgi:hypothetical protein